MIFFFLFSVSIENSCMHALGFVTFVKTCKYLYLLSNYCIHMETRCRIWIFRPERGLPSASPPITSVCECSNCAVSSDINCINRTCSTAMCWGVYGLSRPAHPPSRWGWGLWITSCFSLSLMLVLACLFVFESYCCFHTVYRLRLLLVSDLNASEFLRQFASPRSTRFSPSGSSSTWTPFAITSVAPRKELLRCPCEWHCGTCGRTERKSSSC